MMTERPKPKHNPSLAAEDDGFEAYVEGKRRADNPYHIGSENYCAWLRGWNCAETYCGK